RAGRRASRPSPSPASRPPGPADRTRGAPDSRPPSCQGPIDHVNHPAMPVTRRIALVTGIAGWLTWSIGGGRAFEHRGDPFRFQPGVAPRPVLPADEHRGPAEHERYGERVPDGVTEVVRRHEHPAPFAQAELSRPLAGLREEVRVAPHGAAVLD